MNKCLNDLFAYCKGTPVPCDKPTESPLGLSNGCTKDLTTCRHYLKESERESTHPKVSTNRSKK
jgi:hypothetical protein